MNNTINIITDYLKKNLSEKRFMHSIQVANEAKNLAKIYHIDENKAYLAGLAHDIAKEFSDSKNTYFIEKYHLSYTEATQKIIHADIGALFVKEEFNLPNDIQEAIKYHTIGNPNMSTLSKIIFIADKTARTLTPLIEKEKALSYENLDKAIYLIIKTQEENLKSKGKSLHPDTIKLLNKIQKENNIS